MRRLTLVSLLLGLAIFASPLLGGGVQTDEDKILRPLDRAAKLTVTRGDGPGKPIVGLEIVQRLVEQEGGFELAPRRLSKDMLAPLKQLKHLRSLKVDCPIDPAALASLEDLIALQGLDLWGDSTDVTLSGLKDLTRLRALDFYGPKVSDNGLANLEKLTRLESLRMHNAKKITDAGLAHLADLVQLRELSLHKFVKITDAGLVHLANLVELRELSLHESQVGDKGLAHMRRMTKMRLLDLSQTKIEGPGLAHLAAMDDLEELNLTGTMINNAGVEHLPAAKRLRWVNVRFTEVRPCGLTACPGGKIKLEVKGLTGQLRNATTNEAIGPQLRHPSRGDGAKIVCWAFSPDSKLLATGSGYKNERGDGESMGEIRIWDVATGKLLAKRERGMGYVHGLAFLKDRKTLVFRADRYKVDGA